MFMHLFPTEEPMSCWEWWTRCTLWIPLWEKHWEELLVRINIKHHPKHSFTWSSYYITQNNTLNRKVPLLIRLKQFQSFQTRIFLTLLSGGYTVGPKALIELLRQRSRPYLFSNSLPPPVVGCANRAVEMLLASNEIAQSMAAKTMR